VEDERVETSMMEVVPVFEDGDPPGTPSHVSEVVGPTENSDRVVRRTRYNTDWARGYLLNLAQQGDGRCARGEEAGF